VQEEMQALYREFQKEKSLSKQLQQELRSAHAALKVSAAAEKAAEARSSHSGR